MSNPTDPTTPNPDAQPTEAYGAPVPPPLPPSAPSHPDAQATQAYPDAQPTEVYGQPAPGQQFSGQQSSGQPSSAPSPYGAPGPKAPDTRPKALAWAALASGILGFVLILVAFIPLVWVSLALAVVGGLLLLVAFVLGIVAAVNKKQGGTGIGIAAIAVSVIGGVVWIIALSWALVVIGLSTAGNAGADPVVVESVAPDDSAEEAEGAEDVPAGAYDEAAYLAEVRPQLVTIMQELDASFTEESLNVMFTDETLVSTGKGFLVVGETARETFVGSLGGSGVFTEEQATRFYDAILDGARQHLVE